VVYEPPFPTTCMCITGKQMLVCLQYEVVTVYSPQSAVDSLWSKLYLGHTSSCSHIIFCCTVYLYLENAYYDHWYATVEVHHLIKPPPGTELLRWSCMASPLPLKLKYFIIIISFLQLHALFSTLLRREEIP